MKRIFLLAAALGCISLYSCDNEQDLDNLSPEELEIIDMNNLIVSQSGFNEEALLTDLKRGTMKMKSWYQYNNGSLSRLFLVGGHLAGGIAIFFDEGICFDCYDSDWFPETGSYPCREQFSWQYNPATQSFITQHSNNNYSECSAKILYYNTEDHRLIIEGDMFNLISTWKLEKVRISGYIDVDPAERERIIEKYCGE